MRRRVPHLIELSDDDHSLFEQLARDGRTEQRIAHRARILMAMADSETSVQRLAERFGLARNTIWYLCRRYEAVGTEAVFDAPRSGRPRLISPLAKGRD
jgi:transposase